MRKVVIAVVTCVLAFTAIVALLFATLDVERYRGEIEARLSQAVGRDVKLSGPMSLELSLRPRLIAQQVSIANPGWASRPQLATFERIEATVALLPLFARRVEVDRLAVDGADVRLERNADGRGNWHSIPRLADAAPSAPSGGAQASEMAGDQISPVAFAREVLIRGSHVVYADARLGIEHDMRLDDARLLATSGQSPVTVDIVGQLDSKPLSLRGSIGPMATLLDGTGPYPVDLQAKALDVELAAKGAAALGRAAPVDLQLTASAGDIAAARTALTPFWPLLGLLDINGPLQVSGHVGGSIERPSVSGLALTGHVVGLDVEIKGGIGDVAALSAVDLTATAQGEPTSIRGLTPALPPGTLSASVHIAGTKSALVLDPLELKQADSDLGGKLSVALDGQRPRVSGQLSSQLLRLPLRQRAGSSEKGQAVGLPLFSNVPLDLVGLRAIDGDIAFEAAKLFAGGIELQGVKLQATLAGVVLTIDHLNGAFAGSPFESSGALDASGTVPTASLRLDSKALDLGALLATFELTDLVQAKGRLRVAVRASGDSTQAMAQNLAGRADAVFVDGRINADAVREPIVGLRRFFGALLSPLRPEWEQLTCIANGFSIEDGVARPDVMFMDTAVSSAVGTGKIDIGRERYALTITPSAKGLNLDLGLPIRVTGPLTAPEIGLDEKGAVAGVSALVGKLLFPPALIAGMIDFAGEDSACVRAVQAANTKASTEPPKTLEDAAGAVLDGLGKTLQQLLPR